MKKFINLSLLLFTIHLSVIGISAQTAPETQLTVQMNGYIFPIKSVAISFDGRTIVTGGDDRTVKIWDVASGRALKTLRGHTESVTSVHIAPNGQTIASGSSDNTVKLWNVNGLELKTLKGHTEDIISVVFSFDWKVIASESQKKIFKFWDVATGRELKTLTQNDPDYRREVLALTPGHLPRSNKEDASRNGRFLVKVEERRVNLYSRQPERLLASLIAIDSLDWAVVTPEGLFDCSPNARRKLYYAIGDEPINLEQMKDVYYIPGLLRKIFEGEPLPKVQLFSKEDLFPAVEIVQPNAEQKDLIVKLTNRGGGIGQVQILVNGKEFIKDARPPNFDPDVKEPVMLSVNLKDAPLVGNQENKIEVVAGNAAGSLTTRGTARGTQIVKFGAAKKDVDVNIYAIVGGISNYAGENLQLNFAAKDAEDFARALELGAIKLLNGDKSKVHIRLLTSNGNKTSVKFGALDAKISTATKTDFERAFADFRNATPNDVFIVYLAGHGISLNLNRNPKQAGGDTYLYLTQEATTTDKSVLTAENLRRAMTVSSEELKDLMKQNKALKQVLILDTCAAGQLAESFVTKRDLPSDQIRAIERLKDNTGFYILMGSAADAVSYETNKYGQGLLTYSLLQGLQGAGLLEDKFADVELLFSYAVKKVPEMAINIGGIQQPRTITPDTSRSFSIGTFTADERKEIKLNTPKPLILRPNLQNEKLRFDNLKLTELLRQELRNISFAKARGEGPPVYFVETDEMIDANKPSGGYLVDGENLTITVVLVRNNEQVGKEISVAGKLSEKENLIRQLVVEMIKVVQ